MSKKSRAKEIASRKKPAPLTAKLTGPLVEVDCLGIGAIAKPHKFLTNDRAGNRICTKCQEKSRKAIFHPMEEEPYRTSLDGH